MSEANESLFCFILAVQYNEKDGFTTWLDLFKEKLPEISKETDLLFQKINNGKVRIKKIKDFDHLLDVHNITEQRDELKKFFDTWDRTGDVSKAYQKYLKDNGKATTTFADITKKAGNIIKGFGAALASMAVNFAIGKIIDITVTAIDNYVNAAKYAKEKADAL